VTGHTLKFIRFGWLSGLAVILLLGSNDVLAVSRRSQTQQPQAQTRNSGPQAAPTTCQAPTAAPQGQGRGDRGGGNPTPTPGGGSPNQGGGGGRGGPGGSGGPGFCWWHDESIKKEIGLRDDQIRRIDALYERRAKDMAPFLQELSKEYDTLQQMTRERTVEDSTFAVQISKWSSLDQRIRDSRLLMNYRAYRVLDPEQYKKLQAYMDKLRADFERRGRGGAAHPAAR
jgi:Spy/CpxP family protein refolding chaperone